MSYPPPGPLGSLLVNATRFQSTGRTEAFSDGVMAIAITLLILNVRVDTSYVTGHGLLRALGHEWPAYLAYLTAFITIAIMWLNHHALFDKVAHIDKPLAWTNLVLLLTVSVLPFPTAVVADYVQGGGINAKVAVAAYGLVSVVNGGCWMAAWHHLAAESAIAARALRRPLCATRTPQNRDRRQHLCGRDGHRVGDAGGGAAALLVDGSFLRRNEFRIADTVI